MVRRPGGGFDGDFSAVKRKEISQWCKAVSGGLKIYLSKCYLHLIWGRVAFLEWQERDIFIYFLS